MGKTHAARMNRPAGFTLIELLIAVSLMVMIILVSSYIFDTTIKAVSQTQANNELSVSLDAFSQLLRNDIKTLEHQGLMIFGARLQSAFGSIRDRSNQLKRPLRYDWMEFFTATEQDASADARSIGISSRTFLGHGDVTNPVSGNYSNIGTDWVLIRHQVLRLARTMVPGPTYEGTECPETGDYVGMEKQWVRGNQSYTVRQFYWYWMFNYNWGNYSGCWSGGAPYYAGPMPFSYPFPSVPTRYVYDRGGTNGLGLYEPSYFHVIPWYNTSDWRRFHALPHCASFTIQYAMPEDVNPPGGATLWRDPPFTTDGGYADLNYKGEDPQTHLPIDPLHPYAGLTNDTARDYYNLGRLAFGPGDRWPAMLKFTIHAFDPLDRYDGGKKMTVIVAVP